jgi:hypothetical protein
MEGVETNDEHATIFLIPEAKNLASVFGKYHELPLTRAMKTRVKNLISKLARLQTRLLKVNGMAPLVQDQESTTDSVEESIYRLPSLGRRKYKIEELKKTYQFRLVDVQSFRRHQLGTLNINIALMVWKALYEDVNADIADTTATLADIPTAHLRKLEAARDAALSSSLLIEQEKTQMSNWWSYLINFNKRLMTSHLVKCKSGSTAVSTNNQYNYLAAEVLENALINVKMLTQFSV